MMINTADGTNFTANALDPQQELDSLVTKLQSQEARLNWMIEAVSSHVNSMQFDQQFLYLTIRELVGNGGT